MFVRESVPTLLDFFVNFRKFLIAGLMYRKVSQQESEATATSPLLQPSTSRHSYDAIVSVHT